MVRIVVEIVKRVLHWLAEMFEGGLLSWEQLRSVGNSRIVQTSVLFPILGYLILFNDQVLSLLALVGLDHAPPHSGPIAWIWARKLYFLYFGLMSLGSGSLLYVIRCPFIVKKHGDASDFVRFDGPTFSINALRHLNETMRGRVTSFAFADHEIDNERPDILRSWYYNQAEAHRFSREAVAFLFGLGFLFVSVPSAISFFKISALLFQ
jgi:hypothetical protein